MARRVSATLGIDEAGEDGEDGESRGSRRSGARDDAVGALERARNYEALGTAVSPDAQQVFWVFSPRHPRSLPTHHTSRTHACPFA